MVKKVPRKVVEARTKYEHFKKLVRRLRLDKDEKFNNRKVNNNITSAE